MSGKLWLVTVKLWLVMMMKLMFVVDCPLSPACDREAVTCNNEAGMCVVACPASYGC